MAASILAPYFLLACLVFNDLEGIASGVSRDAESPIGGSLSDIRREKRDIFNLVANAGKMKNCVIPANVCPNKNVTFWLFTRSTQDNPSKIEITDAESLKRLPYGRGHPWKLILHGYTGHRDFSPNRELRPAFFKKGDYNIISIDYGPLVQEPCYLQSVLNVPLVAECTAQMIDKMIAEGIFNLEDLHVIGFSLGGQVSGQLSLFLKSGKLARITGLDPALPLFLGPSSSVLDESDAEFVDVIHTDAAKRGQLATCGHADFYPNGGYIQPGCKDAENSTLSSCDHLRAPIYYAESINSEKGFWGISCSNSIFFTVGLCKAAKEDELVIMGEYTPVTARGIYYLQTTAFPPYALGQKLDSLMYSQINSGKKS